MFAPSVLQYSDQQQQDNEEALHAQVRALVRSAGRGVLWQVYTAKRKVRPSPAAFWRFIAAITPAA
jgi:hypothetical protein